MPRHAWSKPDPRRAFDVVAAHIADAQCLLVDIFRWIQNAPLLADYAPHFEDVPEIAFKRKLAIEHEFPHIVIVKGHPFVTHTFDQKLCPRDMQDALVDEITLRCRHTRVGQVYRQNFIFVLHIRTQQGGSLAVDRQLHFADVSCALVVKALNASPELLDVAPPVEYGKRVAAV